MTTTYVFGAGASLHVGYPLTSTMGTGLLDWMQQSPIERYRAASEYLIQAFGRSPNVEDVITELESNIRALKDSKDQKERTIRTMLADSRGQLGESLREWFRAIHKNSAAAYADFADKVIQRGDVIITFNYDDSLERELKRSGKWDISCGYGFPLGTEQQPSDVLMLKLHGSMNWLVSILNGAISGPIAIGSNLSLGQHPVIHQADLEYLGYKSFPGHLYPGGGAFPALIMPGRKKEFFYETSFGCEFAEFWDGLWSRAARAVKRSEKLVLCGYSLLSIDQRACDLLLQEPRKETHVVVVSGSQTERIANDFRTAGFENVENFKGGHFEDWVQS